MYTTVCWITVVLGALFPRRWSLSMSLSWGYLDNLLSSGSPMIVFLVIQNCPYQSCFTLFWYNSYFLLSVLLSTFSPLWIDNTVYFAVHWQKRASLYIYRKIPVSSQQGNDNVNIVCWWSGAIDAASRRLFH